MSLARSSALGMIATLVMGASLLVPFRIGIEFIGSKEVGAWALVQSIFIISRLPEMGIGLNLTRAIAAERKRVSVVNPWPYVWAAAVLTILPVFLIGCILVTTTPTLLVNYFMKILSTDLVWFLCFSAMGVAVTSAISTVLLSIIEGFGHFAHRQFISIASNITLILFAYPLISNFGLFGLALTYFASGFTLLIISIFASFKFFTGQDYQTGSFEATVKELWSSNLQVSTMAVTRMTFEPFTKLVVANFGNLAAVAYVDLAIKLTTQTRVLIQSAVQPLLAYGARQNDESHDGIIGLFQHAQDLVIKSNLLLMSCQFLSAGAISQIALTEVSPLFTLMYFMLVVGNGLNSLGVVGYYLYVSAGKMKTVVSIHVQMMMINGILGFLGGWILGPVAAVGAYSVSFAIGGVLLYEIWRKETGKGWLHVLKVEQEQIILALVTLLASGIFFLSPWTIVQEFWMSLIGFMLAICLAGWFVFKNWQALRGRPL